LFRLPFYADHGIVLDIDPYLALEKIFVNALRNGLSDEAMVGHHLLFVQQVQSVIGRADSAWPMSYATWITHRMRRRCRIPNP
jgi:hypothetical protein